MAKSGPRSHTTGNGKRMGRPRWDPTAEDMVKLSLLVAKGLSEGEIGACFGKSGRTIARRKQDLSQFRQVCREAKISAKESMGNVVWETAMDKSNKRRLDAAKYWLDRQGGWIERKEITGVGGGPIEAKVEVNHEVSDKQAGLMAKIAAEVSRGKGKK